jgi:hypothetical protein
MTSEQEERLVSAFESIASTFTRWYDRQFPNITVRTEEEKLATFTKIPSEEDRLRESLGDTGEATTEEWIGLREKEFIGRGKT